MKRLLTLTIALLVATTIVTAQDTPVNQDTTQVINNDTIRVTESSTSVIDVDGHSFKIVRKKNNRVLLLPNKTNRKGKDRSYFRGHWEGVDWGVNTFMDSDNEIVNSGTMEVKIPRSMEWSFNFAQFDIGLQKKHDCIGLVTGIGLTFNDYHFANHITLDKVDGITQPFPVIKDHLKRTKFTASYINIPLLLEFQIPVRHDRLFIQMGAEGGINLGSHTKVRYKGGKDKDHGDFNVNAFRARGIFRLGFSDFSIFAKYSLTPLFEKGNHAQGMEVYPLSVGFSFF